jgi:hypothetical protein
MRTEYFRLNAPADAEPEVLKYQGQIMQRFPLIDTETRIGLAPLGGRDLEGTGIRVPEEYALPCTAAEVEHGEWLSQTFFERVRYVTEEERAKALCQSCQGSGLKGKRGANVIAVTQEERALLRGDGMTITERDECGGEGRAFP